MENMTDCNCENCCHLFETIDDWYCYMVHGCISDPENEKCGYWENNNERKD
jgi:hypothetical protein